MVLLLGKGVQDGFHVPFQKPLDLNFSTNHARIDSQGMSIRANNYCLKGKERAIQTKFCFGFSLLHLMGQILKKKKREEEFKVCVLNIIE